MNVYVYQSALICEDCGIAIREKLADEGKAPTDPDDESSYDSDDFPKGPYPDGGGESDTPQHCDMDEECKNAQDNPSAPGRKMGIFLENPLTNVGVEYVKEAVAHGAGVAREVWAQFYDIEVPTYDLDDG